MAYMSRMISGKDKDATAQVLLNIAEFEWVPLEDASEQVRQKATKAKEQFKSGYWSDMQPVGEEDILVTFFLTSVNHDDNGMLQVDGGGDGAISSMCLLPEHAMRFMANNPKSTLRSAMLGDVEVDVNASQLRECVVSLPFSRR